MIYAQSVQCSVDDLLSLVSRIEVFSDKAVPVFEFEEKDIWFELIIKYSQSL